MFVIEKLKTDLTEEEFVAKYCSGCPAQSFCVSVSDPCIEAFGAWIDGLLAFWGGLGGLRK